MACNCKKNVNTKYVDNENFGYTENDRKMWMKKYEEIEQYCG